jgi:hypothetical protein
MRLNFAATGHTPVEDSPEMMNIPLKKSFPGWRAAVEALSATFFVHLDLVFVIPNDHIPAQSVIDFLSSILCMGMMPLLFAGVSKPREETESQRNHEDELPEEISKFEAKNGGLITYIRTADEIDILHRICRRGLRSFLQQP